MAIKINNKLAIVGRRWLAARVRVTHDLHTQSRAIHGLYSIAGMPGARQGVAGS